MSCSCSRAHMHSANTSFGSLCTFSFSFVQDILPAHILHIKILYILRSECKLLKFLEYFISSADFFDCTATAAEPVARPKLFCIRIFNEFTVCCATIFCPFAISWALELMTRSRHKSHEWARVHLSALSKCGAWKFVTATAQKRTNLEDPLVAKIPTISN